MKLNIAGNKPLYTASVYRAPNSDLNPLAHLERSVGKVKNSSALPHVIITGDSNLPSIQWTENYVKANPQYGYEINDAFIEMVNDKNLSQVVSEPTRFDNTLDLILTTSPSMVTSCTVKTGMSDHICVINNINLKLRRPKKTKRKVYLYKKENIKSIKRELKQKFGNFKKSSEQEPVEETWQKFKSILMSAIEKTQSEKKIISRAGMYPGEQKR